MVRLYSFFVASIFSVQLAYACEASIKYMDVNGDGVVDYESHNYVCVSDFDWVLIDEDFDGRYDIKIHYGVVTTESKVDIPIEAILLTDP